MKCYKNGKFRQKSMAVLTKRMTDDMLLHVTGKNYFHIEEISYSEWWRYRGPVKPRQPLAEEGANLSDYIEQ